MIKKKILIFCIIALLFSCNNDNKKKVSSLPIKKVVTLAKKKKEPLYKIQPAQFKTIPGKWVLMYPNRYGYSFYFSRNFKSVVILYLKSYALVFKGVYTFENNLLKINVYEMKNSSTTGYINLYRNFTKVKSSQFIYKSNIRTYKSKKKILVINPVKITIDGNTSDGYFEPTIKLKKIR